MALATIVGAWIFEYLGYAPCELCLLQRWAYYAAIPFGSCRRTFRTRSSSYFEVWPIARGAGIWIGSMVFGIIIRASSGNGGSAQAHAAVRAA